MSLHPDFMDACIHGMLEQVKDMVESGKVDLSKTDSPSPPFAFAVGLAIEGGHITVAKYLLTHPTFLHINLPSRALSDAIFAPSTDMLEFLMFDPSVKHRFDHTNEKAQDLLLFKASQSDNIDFVKFLLTDPRIDPPINIHAHKSVLLNGACHKANMDMVRYLLTSSDLKEHADIHSENDLSIISAIQAGHVELIKYLLYSVELKEHANFKRYPDWKNAIKQMEEPSHQVGVALAPLISPIVAWNEFRFEKALVEGLFEGWTKDKQAWFLEVYEDSREDNFVFSPQSLIEAHRKRQELTKALEKTSEHTPKRKL